MKTTKVMVSEKKVDKYEGDLLVFFVAEPEKKEELPLCDPLIQDEVARGHEYGDFSGKAHQTLLFYPDRDKEGAVLLAKRVLLVGIGKAADMPLPALKGVDSSAPTLTEIRELFRKTGGTVAKVCAGIKATKIMVTLPSVFETHAGEIAECVTEGILLGDYRFLKYKTKTKKKEGDEPDYEGLSEVKCYPTIGAVTLIRKAVKQGLVAAQAACKARDMAHEPGNGWKASDFAAYAEELAKRYELTYSFFDKEKLQELKMGGILAVNQGSEEAPGMVILEYRPKRKAKTILLVGKGITFDSGGICVKPAAGMQDMKYDMCGGAAVLATMQAVGQEQPNVGVVAIVPATDNLSGSGAVKPGDIIRHYNGTTSEIINTDAEGRMILADALAYGIEKFKPDCVVDIATLTGAVIMGLGHHYSGLMSNNDALVRHLEEAGRRAGEPLWRLPLGKDYSKQIESKVADIKNTGGKSAGTITAGAYLEHFVGDTPWAHIDIAGTAWDFTEKSYIPKGPSGIGVRTFVELVRQWKKEHLNG